MQGKTITELYPNLLSLCLDHGEASSPRGMGIREVVDASFTIDDVSLPYVLQKARKPNYAYLVLEPILLTMPQTYSITSTCCFYVGKFLREYVVNKDTKLMDGWYGDRMNRNGRNQLLDIYQLLKEDPDSRRAILTIHSSHEELARPSGLDIPCTLTLQFLMRNNRLDMIVNMRGNDVMLGTPQNVAMWTFFQRMMACWLGVRAGQYHQRIGSLHLYERDVEKAAKIIETKDEMTTKHPFNITRWHWDIADPIESLMQCELFARAEHEYRRLGTTGYQELLSPDLKRSMEVIMMPYIDKKRNASIQ